MRVTEEVKICLRKQLLIHQQWHLRLLSKMCLTYHLRSLSVTSKTKFTIQLDRKVDGMVSYDGSGEKTTLKKTSKTRLIRTNQMVKKHDKPRRLMKL